jgi:hypothetical protein
MSVWNKTINTPDTPTYLEANGDDQRQEGARVLSPNYGASLGGA